MIFVTGGTGFLGRNLIPLLSAAGHDLRVLVRDPAEHRWLDAYPNISIVQGRLRDVDAIHAGMRGCRYVVHAAGLFRMWGAREAFQQANVQGTINVVEAALAAGVERFIHISTVAVVGNPTPGQIIDETHPLNPADPYHHSKLAGENVIQQYIKERNLPALILRPGAFYGPYGRYAFNRLFFEDPLKGLLVKVNNGKHIIFPVYIGDVAAAIRNALTYGSIGEIYNICGNPLTHNEANRIVSEEARITPWRINTPTWMMLTLARAWTWLSEYTGVEPYYPINLRYYVFNDWQTSSEKARDELHFRPTPFRVGTRLTLAWYREQGFRWAR
jgi:dihydroflavonol-4-reductase